MKISGLSVLLATLAINTKESPQLKKIAIGDSPLLVPGCARRGLELFGALAREVPRVVNAA